MQMQFNTIYFHPEIDSKSVYITIKVCMTRHLICEILTRHAAVVLEDSQYLSSYHWSLINSHLHRLLSSVTLSSHCVQCLLTKLYT